MICHLMLLCTTPNAFSFLHSYLELADWVLEVAVHSARDDGEWDSEIDSNSLRSGEIRISFPEGKIHAKGAGLHSKPKVTTISATPAIATKTVTAQDVYQAGPQQNSVGVELKALSSRWKD